MTGLEELSVWCLRCRSRTKNYSTKRTGLICCLQDGGPQNVTTEPVTPHGLIRPNKCYLHRRSRISSLSALRSSYSISGWYRFSTFIAALMLCNGHSGHVAARGRLYSQGWVAARLCRPAAIHNFRVRMRAGMCGHEINGSICHAIQSGLDMSVTAQSR